MMLEVEEGQAVHGLTKKAGRTFLLPLAVTSAMRIDVDGESRAGR